MKGKYYAYVVIITLFLTAVSFYQESKEEGVDESASLLRGEPGEGEKEIELELTVPELKETVSYQLSLSEREYGSKEREELFAQAKKEIEAHFAAEGETMDHITRPVFLPTVVQEGLVEVEWSFGDSGVIVEDGSIDPLKVDEDGTLVQVCALLRYKEYECLYEFPVWVYPMEIEGVKDLMSELEAYFERKEQQGAKEAKVILPKELKGYVLRWSDKKSHTPFLILGLGVFSLFLIPWYLREKEAKQRQERRLQLEMEYPEMLTEFSLLLGAGMTVRTVWGKLAASYQKQLGEGRRKRSELYEQMKLTYRCIQDGAGEVSAYEGFAERCGTACYRRFTMLLTQYLQKGAGGLTETLELEAAQAFEERKNLAKRRGEEAGTKLLFPMLMMLFVVIAIMLIPACMTMEL